MQTLFFRLLARDDKEATLASAIATANRGELAAHVFHVDPSSFRQVPGSPFAYAASTGRDARRAGRVLAVAHGRGRQATRRESAEIDDIAFRLYGIEGVDRRAIEEGVATPTPSDEEMEESEDDS